MGRRSTRQNGMRAEIAAAAARLMAEDGIDDFALAKRKAARQLGAGDTESLPANAEIEDALRAYRALYQADEHPELVLELRRVALEAMRALQQFTPYLTGPVLSGNAGPFAEIELQLYPDSAKDVELFLLERNIAFETSEGRRFSGDRTRSISIFSLDWDGVPVRLSVLDPRDERIALKKTLAGRVTERAGIAEVGQLVQAGTASPPDRTVR